MSKRVLGRTNKEDMLNEYLKLGYENKRLKDQIEKFKKIAVHVQEHCCDDCEDTSMCEFGCAITELKLAILENKKSSNGGNE